MEKGCHTVLGSFVVLYLPGQRMHQPPVTQKDAPLTMQGITCAQQCTHGRSMMIERMEGGEFCTFLKDVKIFIGFL